MGGELEIQIGVLGQSKQTGSLHVRGALFQNGTRKVIQQHFGFWKLFQQSLELGQAIGAQLHAHGNVVLRDVFPHRKAARIVQTHTVVCCSRMTCNEHTHATQAGVFPTLDLRHAIGLQGIDRIHTHKLRSVGFHAIERIAVVMAIAGGSLNQNRFGDACFFHGLSHAYAIHRSLFRPVRLFAAHRRQRVANRIIGNHVAVGVHHGHAQRNRR